MFKVYESMFMGHKVSKHYEEGLLSYDERFSNRRVGKKILKFCKNILFGAKKILMN